jgi:hypothetical protein
VIEMAVGKQKPIKSAESGTAPKQLTLYTFSAVYHDAVAAGFH